MSFRTCFIPQRQHSNLDWSSSLHSTICDRWFCLESKLANTTPPTSTVSRDTCHNITGNLPRYHRKPATISQETCHDVTKKLPRYPEKPTTISQETCHDVTRNLSRYLEKSESRETCHDITKKTCHDITRNLLATASNWCVIDLYVHVLSLHLLPESLLGTTV